MAQYEYRVLPAPAKGDKVKGAKTSETRFAAAVEAVLNREATDGWEFLRAETLPQVERQGLTGSRTLFQTLLVFRRALDDGPAPQLPARDETATEEPTVVAQPEREVSPSELARSLSAER